MKKDKIEVDKYPEIYRNYLEKEGELVKYFAVGAKKVLDVGCGTGRIIPLIAPVVGEYVGLDLNKEYLEKAREYKKEFDNVDVLFLDAKKISEVFERDSFDRIICLWNTMGCLENNKSDKIVVQEMAKVTKDKCFFTVIAKGTLEERKKYYEGFGIEYDIDEDESIHSAEWGTSKAYSEEDIRELIDSTGFNIEKIEKIVDFAFAVYLVK